MKKIKIRIKFEKLENIIEILPSLYYHKQAYRERYEKGVIVIGWLKWAIVIYMKNDKQ